MVIAIMVSQEDNPMDIKVNDVSRAMPVENQTKTSQAVSYTHLTLPTTSRV